MSKLANLLFSILLLCVPFLSYVFLDEIYLRKSEEYVHKWLARESQRFSYRSVAEILAIYRDVIYISSDLKGLGIAKNGLLLDSVGELPATLLPDDFTPSVVVSKRIGFLEYLSGTMVPNTDLAVVFVFADDTASLDFFVLDIAALSIIAALLLARRQLELSRIKTIRETTILTMQGLAHDLRAPLSKLQVFAQRLRVIAPPTSHQTEELLQSVEHSVRIADAMLADFLDFGPSELLRSFSSNDVIKTLQKSYGETWELNHPETGIVFSAETSIWALGSPHKTLRILYNLIDNALAYARSNVYVTVSVLEEKMVHFAVANDGAPIAHKDFKRIFQPFQTFRPGGHGLGLFVCWNFAKAQGGRIEVHSDLESTRFSFVLPAGEQETVQPLTNIERDCMQAKYTIAYVDDEAFYRKAVSEILASAGFRVQTYGSTDDLLHVLRTQPGDHPDLLLVDRLGPGFDAVVQRFPESCRDYRYCGPMVLYSNSVIESQNLAGFSHTLDKTKPLTSADLVAIIKSYSTHKDLPHES